jgi:hypothetical protein
MTGVHVMTKAISGGQQCGGRKRQGTGLCAKPAGWGTNHPGFGSCKLHGGSTPNAAKAAAEAEGVYLLGKFVGERKPVDDPFAELRRIGALALAWMEACQDTIKDLKSFRYEDAKGAEQLRSEIPMFERSMDHAATLLATIAKLGLDEREVAVSEAKATMMLRALEAGLAENGISGPQATAVRQATSRHLRIVKEA